MAYLSRVLFGEKREGEKKGIRWRASTAFESEDPRRDGDDGKIREKR